MNKTLFQSVILMDCAVEDFFLKMCLTAFGYDQ